MTTLFRECSFSSAKQHVCGSLKGALNGSCEICSGINEIALSRTVEVGQFHLRKLGSKGDLYTIDFVNQEEFWTRKLQFKVIDLFRPHPLLLKLSSHENQRHRRLQSSLNKRCLRLKGYAFSIQSLPIKITKPWRTLCLGQFRG